MNPPAKFTAKQEVEWFAKLAEIKLAQYENTLLLHALIDCLVDRRQLRQQDVLDKVKQMDETALEAIIKAKEAPPVH